MGRGRGKGKKLSITNQEDIAVSGEDEKVHVQRRRGRPQKLPKHNFEEVEKVEDDGSDNTNNGVSNEEVKYPSATEHERKRKRNSQAEEKSESDEVENGAGNRSNTPNDSSSSKSNGFRHIGSRRKSKPCRAAGTGVLCM